MELIDLVSELLYKHNCVIIPQFGGFVANFKSSEFEESRLLLSPNRKKVAFNQSLVENDGLLINALVKRKAISYEQAEKEVLFFAKFLKDRLINYKNYEFKNIGSFYLNKEDRMIFVAYEGLNFYKKSFGLAEVKVRKIHPTTATQKTITRGVKEEVKVVPISKAERKRWINLPQVAASLAVIAVIGLVLWQLLGNSGIKGPSNGIATTENVADSPDQASLLSDILPSDTEKTEAVKDLKIEEVTDQLVEEGSLPAPQKAVKEETFTEEAEPAQHLDVRYEEIMAPEPMYYVAVASFDQAGKVASLKAQLIKKEYQPFEITDANGKQHLCLEKFRNQRLAGDFLSVVKRYDQKNAYLITKAE